MNKKMIIKIIAIFSIFLMGLSTINGLSASDSMQSQNEQCIPNNLKNVFLPKDTNPGEDNHPTVSINYDNDPTVEGEVLAGKKDGGVLPYEDGVVYTGPDQNTEGRSIYPGLLNQDGSTTTWDPKPEENPYYDGGVISPAGGFRPEDEVTIKYPNQAYVNDGTGYRLADIEVLFTDFYYSEKENYTDTTRTNITYSNYFVGGFWSDNYVDSGTTNPYDFPGRLVFKNKITFKEPGTDNVIAVEDITLTFNSLGSYYFPANQIQDGTYIGETVFVDKNAMQEGVPGIEATNNPIFPSLKNDPNYPELTNFTEQNWLTMPWPDGGQRMPGAESSFPNKIAGDEPETASSTILTMIPVVENEPSWANISSDYYVIGGYGGENENYLEYPPNNGTDSLGGSTFTRASAQVKYKNSSDLSYYQTGSATKELTSWYAPSTGGIIPNCPENPTKQVKSTGDTNRSEADTLTSYDDEISYKIEQQIPVYGSDILRDLPKFQITDQLPMGDTNNPEKGTLDLTNATYKIESYDKETGELVKDDLTGNFTGGLNPETGLLDISANEELLKFLGGGTTPTQDSLSFYGRKLVVTIEGVKIKKPVKDLSGFGTDELIKNKAQTYFGERNNQDIELSRESNEVTSELPKEELNMNKASEGVNPPLFLEGAVFEIKDSADNLIETVISDGPNGELFIAEKAGDDYQVKQPPTKPNLYHGDYLFHEIVAPNNHIAADFDINIPDDNLGGKSPLFNESTINKVQNNLENPNNNNNGNNNNNNNNGNNNNGNNNNDNGNNNSGDNNDNNIPLITGSGGTIYIILILMSGLLYLLSKKLKNNI